MFIIITHNVSYDLNKSYFQHVIVTVVLPTCQGNYVLGAFACLSVVAITPQLINLYEFFFLRMGPEQRKKRLNFGENLDHTLDTKKN